MLDFLATVIKYRKEVNAIRKAFLEPVYEALKDGKLDQAEKERLCAVMWAIMDPYLEKAAKE